MRAESTRNVTRFGAIIASATLAVATSAHAAIIPGDLLIYRVGDGTAALGTTSAAVSIDEYTPAGAFVTSYAVPASGGSAMTAVGNATTEGIMSRSVDGSKIVFTGYRKGDGGTSPASDTYLVTPRVIGTIDSTGFIDTSIILNNDGGVTTANTIRSATTANGTAYWTATSVRVGYLPPAGTGTTQIDARNSRQALLSGSTLYASNGSTTVTAKVQSYGTLPTGATAPSPVVSLTTADAVNGFFLCDVDPSVPGDDTLYACSTVASQLLKYSFNGTSWVADGSISSTAQNVTGVVSGTSVTLYLTTTGALQSLTDSSGIGGTLTGTPINIATAGTNTAFRGISLFVPEPASIAAFALVGLLGLRRRR